MDVDGLPTAQFWNVYTARQQNPIYISTLLTYRQCHQLALVRSIPDRFILELSPSGRCSGREGSGRGIVLTSKALQDPDLLNNVPSR